MRNKEKTSLAGSKSTGGRVKFSEAGKINSLTKLNEEEIFFSRKSVN